MGFRSKFRTIKEVDELIDAYFDRCDENGELYSEAGLALALNIAVVTLHRWCDGEARIEFQDSVRRAYMRIQEQLETDPRYQVKGMAPFAMFKLKQKRMGGFTDKAEGDNKLDVFVHTGPNIKNADME